MNTPDYAQSKRKVNKKKIRNEFVNIILSFFISAFFPFFFFVTE